MANIQTNSLKFPGLSDTYQFNKVTNIAPAYDSTKTYAVGDLCSKDNVVYECSTAITTAEAWTAGHWTAKSLGEVVSTLKQDFNELEDVVDASLIYNTASGAIASFDDGADNVPVRDLVIGIEPVQAGSGDPSPENVRPITGSTGAKIWKRGRNVFDPTLYSGGGYNPTNGTQWTLTKATEQLVANADRTTFSITLSGTVKYYTLLIPIPDGQVIPCNISVSSTGNLKTTRGYLDKDYHVINHVASTETSQSVASNDLGTTQYTNKKYFYFVFSSGTTSSTTITFTKPQVEFGTLSEYTPPIGETIPIDWTTEAGTVYGGTLDVTNGVLTATMGAVELGSLSWSLFNTVFYASVSDIAHGKSFINVMSDRYETANAIGNTGQGASLPNNTIRGCSSTGSYIYIKDTAYETSESFKTAMDDVYAVYELAEPVTYQLTTTEVKTLLGQNNIWADTGDTEVTYCADPTLYIAEETAPKVVTVSGSTPSITAVAETRYVCGEVTSISFTPSASGICSVRFTSGTTPAVLTLPNTVKLPEWFDATSLSASTVYEISIEDGVYGVVMTWS